MVANHTPGKILIVDDEAYLLRAIADDFECRGWQVFVAEHGEAALEVWKANPVDLVLSDIRMPRCDGPEFLNALRKSSPLSPPFVFMTGFSDLKNYDVFDRGADAILGKPLNPEVLASVVGELTKGPEAKWLDQATLAPSIKVDAQVSENTDRLQFGRGGFFIASASCKSSESMTLNGLVAFEVDCPFLKSKALTGVGKMVWSRQNDGDHLVNGYGIQIVSLYENCRMEYIQATLGFESCAVIPRGNQSA